MLAPAMVLAAWMGIWVVFFAATLLFFGVVAVALWLNRRAGRRLARLTEMAAALEHADFSARADESGRDALARLGTAMNRMALRTERVIGDLKARDRSLHFLSNHDSLTGLPNHRLFRELVNKELLYARRDDERVAVLRLDVDSFQTYNDSFGTSFGDRLIVAVAERISSQLRETDVVARFAGDEFALALPKAGSVDDLMNAIDRLRDRLKAPFELEDHEVTISVSTGVALFPGGGETSDELLSHAGDALKLARKKGGGSLQRFEPDHSWARAQLTLEDDLRRAVREGGFTVHYQPRVALDDGSVVGLEALARWPHPEQGLLDASAFIPLAESTGLMPALGSWLIDAICRQIAAWDRADVVSCPVSVNISARQFRAGNLVEAVEYALARHELAADLLWLEVTENIAMVDLERVYDDLSRLRELGIQVHLDDFGTGFSSLSFLLKHPIDGLKIDRSFVAGISESDESENMVRAAIALAKSLDLAVTAEGVETREQLDFLRRHGCEAAQGFLLARPAAVRASEALLRRGSVELPAG